MQKIEVVNDKMKLNEIEYYQSLAAKYNLLKTYSSDFHNPDTDSIGIKINHDNCEKLLINGLDKKKMI